MRDSPKHSMFGGLGWWTGALYLVARALRRVCPFFSIEKYYVVAQPVLGGRLLRESRGKDILVQRIDHDDPLISQLPRPPEEMARRFAGGAVCFLAMREDRIIGHLWVTQSAYREPIHRAEFVPQPTGRIAWDFDMWIHPADRLGLAFARLWDRCNSYFREQGVSWTCSRVSAFNPESLRAHARLGMRVMHSLLYFGAGQVELLIADVAPFVALSFSRHTFPVIEVTAPAELPVAP
jgi:hypothetical protein